MFPIRPMVLCVEDDPSVRKVLATMLEALNCDVLTAGTAEEALACVREEAVRPDILLADVILPHMDGVQLYHAVKHSRPQMDVVFISGTSQEALIAGRALPSEAPYLQKPFGFEGLESRFLPLIHATLHA